MEEDEARDDAPVDTPSAADPAFCQECARPLPAPKRKGLTRRFCDDACRYRYWTHKRKGAVAYAEREARAIQGALIELQARMNGLLTLIDEAIAFRLNRR